MITLDTPPGKMFTAEQIATMSDVVLASWIRMLVGIRPVTGDSALPALKIALAEAQARPTMLAGL